jgi:hypothetical protein
VTWARSVARTALLAALLLAVALPVAAEEENYEQVGKALKSGKFGIDLRYRYEDVSDDAFDPHGRASTLRTAVSYRTAGFHHFVAALELENVSDVGASGQHDNGGSGSLSNGVDTRPVIADPALTEVNQVTVGYRGFDDTALLAGRQQIVLGDERFVGPSGWRQNYQSFDAIRVDQSSVPRTKVTYAWLVNANRINGADAGIDAHVVDVAIEPGKLGTLTPYYYDLDFDDPNGLPSTRTVGVRWDGEAVWDAWRLPYHAELAGQRDAGHNPGEVEAVYYRVTLTAKRERWSVGGGYEVLGGSPADGQFSTPLATLHKFNGWADVFLVTPATGLRDGFLSAGYARGGLTAVLVQHDFAADTEGPDHGSELDGMLSWKASWGQTFAAKFASFRAASDGAFNDRTIWWAWTEYRF